MLKNIINNYLENLDKTIKSYNWENIRNVAEVLIQITLNKKQLLICGNGGSAGNAIHMANDFIYGISRKTGGGMRVSALSANPAVITCLANDEGYDRIFSEQIAVLANPGDFLLVLSGSGNSKNILMAIEEAKNKRMITAGIFGYDGGRALEMVDYPIHFKIDDMQIAEDMQLIVGHIFMKCIAANLQNKV
jgi:D-sedoheptulose 7-phosphate isomerase